MDSRSNVLGPCFYADRGGTAGPGGRVSGRTAGLAPHGVHRHACDGLRVPGVQQDRRALAFLRCFRPDGLGQRAGLMAPDDDSTEQLVYPPARRGDGLGSGRPTHRCGAIRSRIGMGHRPGPTRPLGLAGNGRGNWSDYHPSGLTHLSIGTQSAGGLWPASRWVHTRPGAGASAPGGSSTASHGAKEIRRCGRPYGPARFG